MFECRNKFTIKVTNTKTGKSYRFADAELKSLSFNVSDGQAKGLINMMFTKPIGPMVNSGNPMLLIDALMVQEDKGLLVKTATVGWVGQVFEPGDMPQDFSVNIIVSIPLY